MLIDVRRAHFHSAAQRKVFVELPEEACMDKSKVGRLLRSMYGCRDAGVTWEFAICQVMIAIGFVQGRATSSTSGGSETARVLGCHESRNPSTPGYHDCVQSIPVLGRIVEWTADGITWEADLRHAELMRK